MSREPQLIERHMPIIGRTPEGLRIARTHDGKQVVLPKGMAARELIFIKERTLNE